LALPVIIALTIFGGCQKQSTEEERSAETERQVFTNNNSRFQFAF